MNNSMLNHILLVNNIAATLEKCGITTDTTQPIYYVKLSDDNDHCHLLVVGLTLDPFKIKTANAENKANVSERYIVQVSSMIDKNNYPLFIYAGEGWNLKNKYQQALTHLRNMLGKENVIKVNELGDWVKQRLKEV